MNSRMTTEKFDIKPVRSNKWFPNTNLCGQDDTWEKYANFHASVLSGKQKGKKYLIYECTDDFTMCGGYGNRIQAIATLLLFSMLTDHVFLIRITHPVDINEYMLPNAIQWNHTAPDGLKTYKLNRFTDSKQYYDLLDSALFDDDDHIIRVKTYLSIYYYFPEMSHELINTMVTTFSLKSQYDYVLLFGCAFNYLFNYQPGVQQAIESMQNELHLKKGNYIALHVRSHIKDVGEKVFNPLNLNFPFEPMFECAAIAAKSLSKKLNISKLPIYLATDHPTIIEYAKKNYNDMIVFSKVPRFHVDLTKFKGLDANKQYSSGMIGVLTDVEICSRAILLVRSAYSSLSEHMSGIHYLMPNKNLHPFYFYENISICRQ